MGIQKQSIVLAGGCFWCLDAVYRQIRGVIDVISGYAGGHTANPSYYDVVAGETGHAEAVKVIYDFDKAKEDDLLNIFWSIHDPTSLNRQGADVGTQYRSAIFYLDDNQKRRVEESKRKAQKLVDLPIVTEITSLDNFYPAEPEYQDFFANHPEKAYCQIVINPKLGSLRNNFTHLLKSE